MIDFCELCKRSCQDGEYRVIRHHHLCVCAKCLEKYGDWETAERLNEAVMEKEKRE